MIITSLKDMEEIRQSNLFYLPKNISTYAWPKAWGTACTGFVCEGLKPGLLNSFKITIPSVIVSVALASINGYALSFWRFKGANFFFGLCIFGAFIPYQVMIYPLLRIENILGIYSSIPGIVLVHTIFGMPILTLIFRNYYSNLPIDLFKAARIDGGNFVKIFFYVILPMSTPIMIVAVILQVTGIWNDFLLGLVFAGRDNQPMTVQLNNIVQVDFGVAEYNVDMAATILTSLVPLLVYFFSGRWFVRGIAAGALKG
jgi:glucose/mannose transport system permease protein